MQLSRSSDNAAKLATMTLGFVVGVVAVSGAGFGQTFWERVGEGAVPRPNPGEEQTCCVAADVDGDGIADFIVGERTKTPSVVWYKFNGTAWDRFVIDDTRLSPEAGGVCFDVDEDGDPDLVLGQDYSGNQVWWWENPRPDFSKPWKRRLIKDGGPRKHHDQTAGDFDGDGRIELASWNQGGRQLLLFEVPEDPRSSGTWEYRAIYKWDSDKDLEGFPSQPTDVNGDGTADLVGGGRWFEHAGGGEFKAHVIDDAMRFTQCDAGQLVAGGRPEIVFSPGDADGMARWYEWKDGAWVGHDLRKVRHGHTCEIADLDEDGNADVLIGEMGEPGAGDEAKVYVWYGDGKGTFVESEALSGQGIHEGVTADLDGDGDLDIVVKPYHHNAPGLEALLNGGSGPGALGVSDVPLQWRSLFNGRNLSGWVNVNTDADTWSVRDGMIVCTGHPIGVMRSAQQYENFILQVDWRHMEPGGNSGMFLWSEGTPYKDSPLTRGVEVQMLELDWSVLHDRTDAYVHGELFGTMGMKVEPDNPRGTRSKSIEKRCLGRGRWNRYTVVAVDGTMKLAVNGQFVNGIAKAEVKKGYICLESEGAEIHFRNLRILELPPGVTSEAQAAPVVGSK